MGTLRSCGGSLNKGDHSIFEQCDNILREHHSCHQPSKCDGIHTEIFTTWEQRGTKVLVVTTTASPIERLTANEARSARGAKLAKR